MATTVRHATAGDRPRLAATMARAFEQDPVMAWFFPNPATRRSRLERFFHHLVLGGPFGQTDEVYATDDGDAVAVWTPPGRWRIGPLAQLRMLPRIVSIVTPRWAPSRLAGFNGMERQHPESPEHWYLSTLATDPDRQGHGLGSALLHDRLARLDADGVPAYLESTRAENLPLYERHGFEVTGTFDLPKGPRLWLMWRDPRVDP